MNREEAVDVLLGFIGAAVAEFGGEPEVAFRALAVLGVTQDEIGD